MNQLLSQIPNIWQKTLHWQPSDRQIEQFDRLYRVILEGNQKQNLTRITDPQEFWEKHLWDSLVGIAPFFIPDSTIAVLQAKTKLTSAFKVIDIGTGAGFPGLPIAIANPNWSVTMVDSTRKKINFIIKAIAQLQLTNAEAIVSRAEALGRQPAYREQYDLALIRAVGQASVCAEYILPFVRVGGFAVLYRGHWQESDTTDLKSAVEQLGSEITCIEQTVTPLSDSIRNCIYLYKHSPTPQKFPREIGIPNQQPL